AAARARDHLPRRPVARAEARVDDPGPLQHLARVLLDVQLIPGFPAEGVALVRADLRADAEAAQQRERAPGGGRTREVEVQADLAAPEQVQAARGAGETREVR